MQSLSQVLSLKNIVISACYVGVGLQFSSCAFALEDQKLDPNPLVATLNTPGNTRELKSWTQKELLLMRKQISKEKDPQTGKLTKSEGFLLSSLLEKTLEVLPPEGRAQVDLLVISGQSGQRAMIPRALMSKYPLMVAVHAVEPDQASRGLLSLVVPWTSKPKIQNEDLPLESFFVRNLAKIELTNYRHQFGNLFLKRRTDPSAMRGEKIFVQSCAGCHAERSQATPIVISEVSQAKTFAEKGHPNISTQIKLNDRDRKAILRYAEALRMESQEAVPKVVQAQPGGSSRGL